MAKEIHVIMVCLGNICRSPMAEVVLRQQVQAAGLPVRVDSAGTGDWHIGQDANINTIAVLEERGYQIAHEAKQFDPRFFTERDLVVAMDLSNLADLKALAPKNKTEGRAELRLLREFDVTLGHLPSTHPDLIVPDPYGGSLDDFREVLDMVELASTGLTEHLATRL
jgi:protein-tyrosine phosphatase